MIAGPHGDRGRRAPPLLPHRTCQRDMRHGLRLLVIVVALETCLGVQWAPRTFSVCPGSWAGQIPSRCNTAIPPSVCALRAARATVLRMAVLPVEISALHDKRYVRMLSTLLCQSFYGIPEPWEALNLAKTVQRGLVFQEIERDLTSRIDLYKKAGQSPDSSCGALLVAVDADGNLAGFVDISLTLYDLEAQTFQVASGPGRSVPSSTFERRCYISNLAVAPAFRRRGVADQLMTAAHKVAADLPHVPSHIWLEVNERNEAAVKLYTKLGYSVVYVKSDAKDMVGGPLCYYFESVRRLCLFRPLTSPLAVEEPG